MLVEINHIVLAVRDLDAAMKTIHAILGREALTNGDHVESGTRSAIVPLAGSYIELASIVDSVAASAHPFGQLIYAAVANGTILTGWATGAEPSDKEPCCAPKENGNPPEVQGGSSRLSGHALFAARTDRPLPSCCRGGVVDSEAREGTGIIHELHVEIPRDEEPWSAGPPGRSVLRATASGGAQGRVVSFIVDNADGGSVVIDDNVWRAAHDGLKCQSTGLPPADEAVHRMVADRRNLHQIPEVGLQLPQTQQYVLDALAPLGLEVEVGAALSSIVAVLRGPTGGAPDDAAMNSPRRAVLIRSDMDALPIREDTGLPFAAQNGAMHACGHDLHMSMLLEAARALSARRAELEGDIVFVFQPGEENHGGARLMLEEGLLSAGRNIDIIAMFGLHALSYLLPTGTVALREGAILAASTIVTVDFRGQGGHGSAPHRTRDPLFAGASFVPAVIAALAHGTDMFEPSVLTFGAFNSGSSTNVIPDEAVLRGTLRTFSSVSTERAKSIIERVAAATAAAHHVDVSVSLDEICLTVDNDPQEVAMVARIAASIGEKVLWLDDPISVSEDFSYILNQGRGAFALVGATELGHDPQS
ncbi:MAG: amidohydrolase, partial [Rhodoglobus sp.]